MAPQDSLAAWYAGLPPLAQTLLAAIAVAVVVLLIVRIAKALIARAAARSPRVDPTLAAFTGSVVSVVGWLLVAMAFLGALGVDATALAAGAAVGGFIIAFAMKDTLGNLAAGVLLLLNRPFRVGESVSMAGFDGIVEQLGVSMTRMKAWDGRMVTLPNAAIIGGGILNFSRNPTRRVEIPVGIAYGDDIDAAVRAIHGAIEREPRVLREPAPLVPVTGLGESSVDLVAWAWVQGKDFLAVKTDLTKAVKRAVEDAGCSIPFPQRDVHLLRAGDGDGSALSHGDEAPTATARGGEGL